jgi:hypothetical protein
MEGAVMNLPNLTHPWWCASRDQCADRGAHRGRLISIRSASGDFAPLTVQLCLALATDAEPYIVIAGESGAVLLSIRQARALSYACTVEARRATNPGAYPSRRWHGPFRGEPR